MSEDTSRQYFKCPTSGQMLGCAVTAFRLHLTEVGGDTAEFLGSGNAGKRARDYFEGKWIPDETRTEICGWVVKALMHSQLLPRLRIPAPPSGGDPMPIANVLSESLSAWLQIWDAVYAVSTNRWPKADRQLTSFVLARQVIIDLALRWGGLCLLSGIEAVEAPVLEISRGENKATIISRAIRSAGKALTREEFSRLIRAKRPTTNDRTVDRWFDESTIPDDDNLAAIASVLSDSPDAASQLHRSLRFQYAMLDLLGHLHDSVGDRMFATLRNGLAKFSECSIRVNRQLSDLSADDPQKRQELEIAALTLFAMGSASPMSGPWFGAFFEEDNSPAWQEDLRYAAEDAIQDRLIACMRVIGDWPRLKASIESRNKTSQIPIDTGREVMEFAAIMAMNDNRVPPEMAKWMADHPDQVRKLVSDDQMKAAARAEQATAAMSSGDYDGAIPHWARAAELATDDRMKSNFLFFYGGCLWQSRARRFDDAIKALKESYRLWPQDVPQRDRPFVEIAIIYQNRGWFENALAHLETDPEDFAGKSGHFNFVKGRTLKNLNRMSDALDCFEKSIALRVAGLSDAYAHAADCAFELNKAKPDRILAQKGRKYAKEALHLGRSWAHDRWGV